MDSELPFGIWLKKRRKALDLTRGALANRVGCSLATIEKIEAEERRPSAQIAELLANALEIPPDERATFLRVARGLRSSEGLAAISPLRALLPRTNVPIPPTPLIGRADELDGIAHLLAGADCRLVNLIGPGGIGKTRLGVEFAMRRRSMFPGGVYYVPLTPVNVPDLIVPAIADAFAFSFSGPVEPKEQLFNHIARSIHAPALLVLDNLEHLLSQSPVTAELIAELLRRFSHLNILCTSREPLNLHGEWLFALRGLPLPPPDGLHRLKDYSAAELFIQAARRINARWVLTDADKPALLRICHLLEGIPLALELAAAWAGMLSCQEIAREIESNIDFLTVSMRNLPERHRSLRASFDHSWRLLSHAEREALSRLSVFQGGFDRVAAQEVAGAALPLLSSLVSKSLVQRTPGGRCDLHEVIRQYALAQLEQEPSTCIRTRDLHCAYYLRLAAERETDLKSARQQLAVGELVGELGNLRAAMGWAIERELFVEAGAAVRSLGWFFDVSGLVHEGIEYFEPLVRALKTRPANRASQRVLGLALCQQGILGFRKGHMERARSLLEQGLEILRRQGEITVLPDAPVYLGMITHLNGDIDRSQTLFAEGLTCARSTGDGWAVAFAIYNLGYLDGLRGHYEQARDQMLEGLAVLRQLGDSHSIALCLNFLAPTLVNLGSYDQAHAFLQEALELCQHSGNRWGIGMAYRQLGLVEMAQGNLTQAREFFHQALESFGDYFIGLDIARTLIYLGETTILAGDPAEARTILLESLRLARQIHSTPLMLDAVLGLARVEMSADPERAYRWLTVVAAHPGAPRESRARAIQLCDELSAVHLSRSAEPDWTLEHVLQDAVRV